MASLTNTEPSNTQQQSTNFLSIPSLTKLESGDVPEMAPEKGKNKDSSSVDVRRKQTKEIQQASGSSRGVSHLPPRKSVSAPQPPDGGWGWVIVFAAFVSCAGVVGLTRAFGIIYVEILHVFPGSSDLAASWIPGLYNTLSTGMAPVAGALSNRYSCRSVVFAGGILMSFGLVLNFFATSVEYLYISFGVITGAGAGLCTTPGIIMVARYFKKRRALANGLCLAGTSSGAFVQPILVEYLTNQFGFRGAMLIMGGLMLHISAFSLVYRPLEPPKPKRVRSDSPSSKRVPRKTCAKKYCWFLNCFLERNSCFSPKKSTAYEVTATDDRSPLPGKPSTIESVSGAPSAALLSASPVVVITRLSDGREMQEITIHEESDEESDIPQMADSHLRKRSMCMDHSMNDLHTLSAAQFQESIRRKKSLSPERRKSKQEVTGLRRYLDLSLFKNRAFVLFVTSSAFTSVGYPHASVFMPAFATSSLGISRPDTGLLLSITAGTDLVGRIGFGWLSDLELFKREYGYMFNVAMVATATLTLPFMNNYVELAINSAFYGLGVGSFFMLTPVILTDHHGAEKVASSYGLLRLFHGVMSIITPPIAGAIRDSTGSYTGGFLLMGTVMMLGSIIMVAMPAALRYEKNKELEGRRSSVIDPLQNPQIIHPAPKQRRASLESWGRRFSMEPDHN